MHPEGLSLIGPAGLAAIRSSAWGRDVTAVGGLTLGADPIAYAISYASALETPTQLVRAFTVRKEAKTHGTGKLIEGPFETGDHVAIVEDVITTGGSARRAVEAVRAAGGIVVGVLALVDREEGGREALEGEGLKVEVLVRARDVLKQLKAGLTGARVPRAAAATLPGDGDPANRGRGRQPEGRPYASGGRRGSRNGENGVNTPT